MTQCYEKLKSELEAITDQIRKEVREEVDAYTVNKGGKPVFSQELRPATIKLSANSEKEEEAMPIGEIGKDKMIDSDMTNSSVITEAEQNHAWSKSIISKDSSLAMRKRAKRNKIAVLDFSGIKGPFALPYEFRAPTDDSHEIQHKAKQCSVDKVHQDHGARDLDIKEIMLESHQESRKDIIQVKQPPCFSNPFQKVQSTSNLPISQSDHKFTINACISDFIVSNSKRSIGYGDLLSGDISEHVGQYIMQFREPDSSNLLELKLSRNFLQV